jgi:hypothetical protein
MTPVPKKNRDALLVTMLELRSRRRAPGKGRAKSWGHGLSGEGRVRSATALTSLLTQKLLELNARIGRRIPVFDDDRSVEGESPIFAGTF